MSHPRDRRTSPRRFPHWASAVIVVVLALVVIALSVLAISHTRGEPATGAPRQVTGFTSSPAPPPTATASPRPTPTRTPAAAAPGAAERFLAVGSSTLWRATAGACGVTAPVLERSDDDGATWADVTPAYLGIGQILALDPFAGDEAQVVARVGAACELQALRTFTQGRFWQSYPEVLATSTYVNPADAASVVTPRGPIAAPCPAAWGVRALNGTVGVVCGGTAYQLADGSWTQVATDAVAIAVRDGAVLAAHTAAGCGGLTIGTACAGGQPPFAPAAIAVAGGPVYGWVGGAVTTVPAA